MGELVGGVGLYLFEAVEVKLPNKALKLSVPKIKWNYLIFHFIFADDLDHRLGFVPTDDL